MRISDGSSDVCSSDLRTAKPEPTPAEAERARFGLSKDNMQVMMLIRRDMLRAELMQSADCGSSLAMDFMMFTQDRQSIVRGKRVSVRVALGGRRLIQKKNHN